MKIIKLFKVISIFIRKLLSPEIRKGNRDVDEMINNCYCNWEEYRF